MYMSARVWSITTLNSDSEQTQQVFVRWSGNYEVHTHFPFGVKAFLRLGSMVHNSEL